MKEMVLLTSSVRGVLGGVGSAARIMVIQHLVEQHLVEQHLVESFD